MSNLYFAQLSLAFSWVKPGFADLGWSFSMSGGQLAVSGPRKALDEVTLH